MEIGIQFYTLRDYCTNLADFAETLKKVADIGYKNIQISCVCDYDPQWLKEQLDKNGLKCVMTHAPAVKLVEDTQAVCDGQKVFDCNNVGLGAYPFSLTDPEFTYDAYLKKYTPVIKAVNQNGMRFMHHNHAKEFLKLDGVRIIERMLQDFGPNELGFILDTFWVQAAGGDPAEWMQKLKGRIPVIHLKDFSYNPAHKSEEDHIAVVGEGNMNFDRVFQVAESCGVEYMLVEQDECHGENPFDCIKRSYDYLRSCGF